MAKPDFVKGNSFSFTITVEGKDNGDYADILSEEGKVALDYAVWQAEKGKEGTSHLQGSAALKPGLGQVRPKTARTYFKKQFEKIWLGRILKSELASCRYCVKEETRVAGPWHYGKVPTSPDDMKEKREARGAGEDRWHAFWREQCMVMVRDHIAAVGNMSRDDWLEQWDVITECLVGHAKHQFKVKNVVE